MTRHSEERRYITPAASDHDDHVDNSRSDTSEVEVIYIESDSDDMEEDSDSNVEGDPGKQKQYDTTTTTVNDESHPIIIPDPQSLPNEVVSLIICQLSSSQKTLHQCSLVSKQFHAITNPLLWQHPKLYTNHVVPRFLDCLAAGQPRIMLGQFIRKLDLIPASWTDTHLLLLIPHICLLEEIHIAADPSFTDASLRHLPRHCRYLKLLSVSGHLVGKSFYAFGQYCRQLGHLSLMDCGNRLPWNAFMAFTACPVTTLTVSSIQCRTNRHEAKWVDDIKQWKQLVQLKAHLCPPLMIKSLLTVGAGVAGGVGGMYTPPPMIQWPLLTHLDMNGCQDLDDATLVPFIQTHPHLTHIELAGGGQYTDVSLCAMGACLSNLTSMNLYRNRHISALGVLHLVCRSPTLASLSLTVGDGISAAAFLPVQTWSQWGILRLNQKVLDSIRRTYWWYGRN